VIDGIAVGLVMAGIGKRWRPRLAFHYIVTQVSGTNPHDDEDRVVMAPLELATGAVVAAVPLDEVLVTGVINIRPRVISATCRPAEAHGGP